MSKHSIIIIKNDKNEFLQYYDARWNSFLFLNCKLVENYEKEVIADVSSKLNIPENEISCKLEMDKVHTKYSESAKSLKEYHHYFFTVEIKDVPTIMNQEKFNINGIDYAWYNMDMLEKDERIQQVNSDIVNFVKEIKS